MALGDANPKVGAIIPLLINVTDKDGNALNLSTATKKDIVLCGPGGIKLTKTNTTLNGTNQVQYVTLSTDLSVPGTWYFYADIVLGSYADKSDSVKFTVKNDCAE